MAVVPGLARAALIAELETQESELEAVLSALVADTRRQFVVDALPPKLSRSSYAP